MGSETRAVRIGGMAKSKDSNSKPRSFGAVVRDLLIERDYVTAMGNPNWAAFVLELHGMHYETLRKAVTGERPPSSKIMEETAEALGVSPDIFWEYELAKAQAAFDPREVGEEVAYGNLQTWKVAQGEESEESD